MFFTFILSHVILNVYYSNAAVFLWSNKKLEISPLQPFSRDEFSNLIEQLDHPEVYYFRSSSKLSPKIKDIINGYYSAYVPNGEISIEEGIDLLGDYVSDLEKIKDVLNSANTSTNILSVIVIPPKIHKRETENDIKEPLEEKLAFEKYGPVIYKSKHINYDLYALLYSSKPLLFKTNDSDQTELHLPNTDHDMIQYDNRLNVHVIPLEGGSKISLRFIFSWLNGYWSLSSVKITDANNNKYTLTTDEDISAPAHFSYHCNGYSVFSDENGTELYIYDLQVQDKSKYEKFGDANDCVTFTTAPIWSGLFVTTLLGIGLIVALTAIMDIKTMDKFDNHKTKNLSITVSE